MHHLLATMGDAPFQPFHPLRYWGYEFWSGIAGSFLTSLPGWFAAFAIYLRHHNCCERRCWRLGHAHPEHGRPVCHRHFHSVTVRPGGATG